MQTITLEAEAGQLSAELARIGVAAMVRVHVVVEIIETKDDNLVMAPLAEGGGGFVWLAEEPALYTDADLVQPQR